MAQHAQGNDIVKRLLKGALQLIWKILLLTLWCALAIIEVVAKNLKEAIERRRR